MSMDITPEPTTPDPQYPSRKADDTALARMHIGHDTHLGPGKSRLGQQAVNLAQSQFFYFICVDFKVHEYDVGIWFLSVLCLTTD